MLVFGHSKILGLVFFFVSFLVLFCEFLNLKSAKVLGLFFLVLRVVLGVLFSWVDSSFLVGSSPKDLNQHGSIGSVMVF